VLCKPVGAQQEGSRQSLHALLLQYNMTLTHSMREYQQLVAMVCALILTSLWSTTPGGACFVFNYLFWPVCIYVCVCVFVW